MNKPWSVNATDLRHITDTTVRNNLEYFTGHLIMAASHNRHYTMYGRTFTVAVGGAALFYRRSLRATARQALTEQDGLEIVEEWYPKLGQRTEIGWQDALDDAWRNVAYEPGAQLPEDRTVFGHIELLDAVYKGTAHYRSVRIS